MVEAANSNLKEKRGTTPWGKPLKRAKKGEPIIAVTDDHINGGIIELTPIDVTLRIAATESKQFKIKGEQ